MTRRAFLRWLAGLTAAGAAAGAYGFVIEPGFRLIVTRWRLQPPGWPRGRRLRIAALADIHGGGPHMSLERIERIVARTNALDPDLTVLLGDYAASHRFVTTPVPIADTARALARLRARLGVYGVLGNHDWWDDAAAQRRGAGPTISHAAFERVGVPILENDAVALGAGDDRFWLVGLGDQIAFPRNLRRRFAAPPRRFEASINPSAGVDDRRAALAKVTDDAPVIVLAHEPDIFPLLPARAALTLAGHTHGGQVRLLGWAPAIPSRYGDRYAYGPITEGGRTLVVSGGLGCSVLPVRFGVPPEITVIEIS